MHQQFNIAQHSTILTFCGNGTETTIGKVFDSAPVVVDIVFSLLSDECSAPFPMTIPWTGSEFWVRVRVNFLLWSPILRFNINMFVIFQRKVVTHLQFIMSRMASRNLKLQSTLYHQSRFNFKRTGETWTRIGRDLDSTIRTMRYMKVAELGLPNLRYKVGNADPKSEC